MIIIVGGDEAHIANAGKLAQAIKQPVAASSSSSAATITSVTASNPSENKSEKETGKFEELDLSTITDDRITLIGHGSKIRFGTNQDDITTYPGYTPAELIATLKTRGLPVTVKAIDLFACEVGLTDKEGKSYAAEVATLLNQDSQFQHIKLRAFVADASLYSREIVSVGKGTGKVYLFGVKQENELAYQQKTDEIIGIKNDLQVIRDKIRDAEPYLFMKFSTQTVKESTKKRIESLNKLLVETTQKLSNAKSDRLKLRTELEVFDNYRQALDSNDKYHIKPCSITLAGSSNISSSSSNSSSSAAATSSLLDSPNTSTPAISASSSSSSSSESSGLAGKKRAAPLQNTTEENNKTPERIPSPDRKQIRLEEEPLSVESGEKDEANQATTTSSSSAPSINDAVEYISDSDLSQNQRLKERSVSQRIAALGRQLNELYLPKTVALNQSSSSITSSAQANPSSDNGSTENAESESLRSFKPH